MDHKKPISGKIHALFHQKNKTHCFYSDKGIAMATAYHIFQNWKLDQIAHDFISTSGDVRSRLQLLTQKEVSNH